jgi:hypothetical protein
MVQNIFFLIHFFFLSVKQEWQTNFIKFIATILCQNRRSEKYEIQEVYKMHLD